MRWFKRKGTEVEEETEEAPGSLREFVYLDEVSVYSLTSSPDAPPPVAISESSKATSGTKWGASGGFMAPVAKSSFHADFTTGIEAGTQIERQFNIQSQFARLHQRYGRTLRLSAASASDGELPAADGLDLAGALAHLRALQRAVPVGELERGHLVELRISLGAHPVFDVATAIKSLGGLVAKHPELTGMGSYPKLRQTLEIGEFLHELLENLVPIEGGSTVYAVVDTTDGRWVADLAMLTSLLGRHVETTPLRVVGVAERESFWKDTRRVLHADAEYDILGRVARSGVHASWSPIKLLDSVARVHRETADALRVMLENFDMMTSIGVGETLPVPSRLTSSADNLVRSLVAQHDVGAGDVPDSLWRLRDVEDESLETQLLALRAVADDFYQHFTALERDEDTVGRLRQEAWRAAEETPKAAAPVSAARVSAADARPEVLYLELEFIAVYW